MRKAYLIALATVAASLPLWGIALAAGNTAAEYQPLTGIYGITDVGKVSAGNQLSTMLGNVFNLLIGFSGLAAVVMISWGAVLYMFSESLTSKGEGRDKMQNAVIGLLLVLFTYTILYTINPDILELRLFVQKVVAPVSQTSTSTAGFAGNVQTDQRAVQWQKINSADCGAIKHEDPRYSWQRVRDSMCSAVKPGQICCGLIRPDAGTFSKTESVTNSDGTQTTKVQFGDAPPKSGPGIKVTSDIANTDAKVAQNKAACDQSKGQFALYCTIQEGGGTRLVKSRADCVNSRLMTYCVNK